MDKGRRFDWLPKEMPGVTRLIADRRKEVGAQWVSECWRRGVVQGEPGWFYAAEQGLAVGTLWTDAAQAVQAGWQVAQSVPGATLQPVLVLKPREVAHGAAG